MEMEGKGEESGKGDDNEDDQALVVEGEAEPHKTVEPCDARERRAWYIFDWAQSPYSQVCISFFLPTMINAMASYEATRGSVIDSCVDAGMDCGSSDCVPNALSNLTVAAFAAMECTHCIPSKGTLMWSQALSKFVPQPVATVQFGLMRLSGFSATTSLISISVALQFFLFVTVGPMADYGGLRRLALVISTLVGVISTLLFITVTDSSLWWWGGILLIISNVAYGTTIVFYNACLPLLVDAHPEVLEAIKDPTSDADMVEELRGSLESGMSAYGFALGYLAGLIMLVVTLGLWFAMGFGGPENGWLPDRICIFLVGLWWLGFSIYTFMYLKERPSPPMPPQGSVLRTITFGWRSVFATLKEASGYKDQWIFLILYFIYSDSYNSIGVVGILFGQQDLCMGGLDLGAMALIVVISATIGSLLFLHIQRRYKISSKNMVIINLVGCLLVPIWGMVGFIDASPVGIKSKYELWIIGFVFGVNMGPLQSFSRVVFCDFIPVGKESQFFSLYEVTDKGSSWIGPAVSGALFALTGTVRAGLVYIFVALLIPTLCIHYFVDHKKGLAAAGRRHSMAEIAAERHMSIINTSMRDLAALAVVADHEAEHELDAEEAAAAAEIEAAAADDTSEEDGGGHDEDEGVVVSVQPEAEAEVA